MREQIEDDERVEEGTTEAQLADTAGDSGQEAEGELLKKGERSENVEGEDPRKDPDQ